MTRPHPIWSKVEVRAVADEVQVDFPLGGLFIRQSLTATEADALAAKLNVAATAARKQGPTTDP